MCSRCKREENKKNYINNIECDVLNCSDRYLIIGIDADTQTILDPLTVSGLSFVHINVNGIDVEGRIDEMRHLFQRKPFGIIGIKENKI